MEEYLVIGASGLVGYHLQRAAEGIGKSATGTCYQNRHSDFVVIDIRNYADLVSLLEQIRPDVVCLPASLTNVDYCETHPDEGYEVNVELPSLQKAPHLFSRELFYTLEKTISPYKPLT